MTKDEIIEEIGKLPPEKRQIIKVFFEVYENNPMTTHDEFVSILLARGTIKDVSEYTT